MAKQLKTKGWSGGDVRKWRTLAGNDVVKFREAAEADGYDLGDKAAKYAAGPAAPKSGRIKATSNGIDLTTIGELAEIAEGIGGWKKLSETLEGDTLGKLLGMMDSGVSLDDLKEAVSKLASVKH